MKLSVYVPDDLGKRVKALSLPVASICQAALRVAAEQKEAAMTSDTAAKGLARLRASRSTKASEEHTAGIEAGREWALERAEYDELQAVAGMAEVTIGILNSYRIDEETVPSFFYLDEFNERYGVGSRSTFHIPGDDEWFDGFTHGAADVLDKVDGGA